jgi:hypothetical protein
MGTEARVRQRARAEVGVGAGAGAEAGVEVEAEVGVGVTPTAGPEADLILIHPTLEVDQDQDPTRDPEADPTHRTLPDQGPGPGRLRSSEDGAHRVSWTSGGSQVPGSGRCRTIGPPPVPHPPAAAQAAEAGQGAGAGAGGEAVGSSRRRGTFKCSTDLFPTFQCSSIDN